MNTCLNCLMSVLMPSYAASADDTRAYKISTRPEC